MSQVPNLMSGTAPTLPGGGQFGGPGIGIGMDYRSLIGGQQGGDSMDQYLSGGLPDLPGGGNPYGGMTPPPMVSPMPTPGGDSMDQYLSGGLPDLPGGGNPYGGMTPPPMVSPMPTPGGPQPGIGIGMDYRDLAGGPQGGGMLPMPRIIDQGYGVAPTRDQLESMRVPAQSNSLFANQQAPITQGTGQLPPGFGALSPIDRSQISPNASIGMTGAPRGGRVAQGPRMNNQTMFNQSAAARAGSQFGNNLGQTAYGNAPANRYAPPNAPGVRSKPITRPRIR